MTTTDEALKHATDAMDETTKIALEAAAMLHRAHDDGGLPPIEIDDDGWMHGEGVITVPSVRKQKLATPDGHVEGVVDHWTDTRGAGAKNLAERIAKAGASRSCHVWIDAPGLIAQSVSFHFGSWHAGSDTALLFTRTVEGIWAPLAPAQRGKVRGYGANSWAAGIEHENVGELRLIRGDARALAYYAKLGVHGDKVWAGWPFRFDHEERPAIVPPDEVAIDERGDHGLHLYTPQQIAANTRVRSALVRRYGLRRENMTWGHCQIDPTRRPDPGSLWLGGAAQGRARELGGHLRTIIDTVYGS